MPPLPKEIIPPAMRAIALSAYGKPSTYDLATLPTPQITAPDEVLIKVHASAINPIDVKMASGLAKLLEKPSFPYKIGYDVAGTIAAIGPSVTLFKIGDPVYSRVPGPYRGTLAEYALSTESTTAPKPPSLTFPQAASMPLAALTALQSLEIADKALPGGLAGKTVYIAGGLSGTGSFAVQLALGVFAAGRVVTTLSAGKMARARELFGPGVGEEGGEGSRIQYVDYTKGNVIDTIGRRTVDFFFDTMNGTVKDLPVVKRNGLIVSISTMPSGRLMRAHGNPHMAWWLYYVLNVADWYFRWVAGRAGVTYIYNFMVPDKGGLERLAAWVEEGRVVPVVGRVVGLGDVEGVRGGCEEVFGGRGGVGKMVVVVD